mmetsp:Transcript_22061/g.62905  ORF Transcript_22061/g.62905 Transcript_22061/m.62905 type:complete len:151 (-) Transcript_22061:20-472(-)
MPVSLVNTGRLAAGTRANLSTQEQCVPPQRSRSARSSPPKGSRPDPRQPDPRFSGCWASATDSRGRAATRASATPQQQIDSPQQLADRAARLQKGIQSLQDMLNDPDKSKVDFVESMQKKPGSASLQMRGSWQPLIGHPEHIGQSPDMGA